MAKPVAHLRPTTAELRAWGEARLTNQQMADKIEARTGETVNRVTVAKWRKEDGLIDIVEKARRQKYLPWTIRGEHNWDVIARAMRALDRLETDGPGGMRKSDLKMITRVTDALTAQQKVIDYDPVVGFKFLPRDPELDAADDWVRRPNG